jgi:hypothetical protein
LRRKPARAGPGHFIPAETNPSTIPGTTTADLLQKPLTISEQALIKIIYPFIKRNDITLFILFSIDYCTFVLPKQKTGQYKRICYE